jgi:hypothetical protein
MQYSCVNRFPCFKMMVNLSLCLLSTVPWSSSHSLIEYLTTKTYWGVEVQLHTFLTSELNGVEWSASCNFRFTPGLRVSQTPFDSRLYGPQRPSELGGKNKISHHCPCSKLPPFPYISKIYLRNNRKSSHIIELSVLYTVCLLHGMKLS